MAAERLDHLEELITQLASRFTPSSECPPPERPPPLPACFAAATPSELEYVDRSRRLLRKVRRSEKWQNVSPSAAESLQDLLPRDPDEWAALLQIRLQKQIAAQESCARQLRGTLKGRRKKS